jgi:glycosyltransferase involved in cell wall biosynthesis
LPFAAYRRRATQAVDAVSAISEFVLKRHMREGYFKDCSTAKVIFNPLLPLQRKPATCRTGGLVFGYIGLISANKGVRWLLESFVKHASDDDRLVLAGTGNPTFVESMKSEFASSRVTFVGHTDSKMFYERVDVVVVPSLWDEPFGRTAIEPWAYGVPVIASNRGGLAEIVEDGVTGIVVDPDERGSLTRALGRFSADRVMVARLGENCRQRVSRFSQESITHAYASLFTEVMRAG